MANSFVDSARNDGVQVRLNIGVRRLESREGEVRVFLNDGSTASGKKVILATGVWINKLLEESGASKKELLPITASLHAVIYLKRPVNLQGERPVLWDPPNLAYYKPEGHSLIAVGSLDPEIDKSPVKIDDPIPEEASYDYTLDYVGRLVSRIPGMADATMVSSITGLYDMTPDGQAIISSLGPIGLEGVYVCAGLSGHGFKLSPAYGLIVSEMVTDISPEKATFDWRNFRPERFKEGKPMSSKYTQIGTIY